MFDDAKYMAKEAVDRNNALADLDQQRSEDNVRAWSRNAVVRRGVSVLLAAVTVAIPIITGLSERGCPGRGRLRRRPIEHHRRPPGTRR